MMQRFGTWFCIVLMITALTLTGNTGTARAAGFALIEQSVGGLGNAFAGGAASAEDATTVFFNPAGLSRVSNQFIFGTHYIMPSAKFSNNGSTTVLGSALTGGNGGDAGVSAMVPNIYYSRKFSEKTTFGLGINTPFGLATEYPKDWVGRYHGVKSDMMTTNINPSVAYRFAGDFSIGAGLNIQYIKAELSNAIDFGTAAVAAGMLPAANSQQLDGFANMKGDSWGYGYNVGVLFEPTKDTRIGLAYRSAIKHTLEGDVTYEIPANATIAAIAAARNMRNGDITADVSLPDTFSASFYHKATPKLAVMGDYTITGWKKFDELRIKFKTGQADSVTTERWQNNTRASLGVSYYDDALTYRCGVAHDTTPVMNSSYRTPRIPDGSRTWIALGLGYRHSAHLSFDFGGAYLFVNDPEINKTATGEDQLRGALKGSYDANVKILSAQVNWTF